MLSKNRIFVVAFVLVATALGGNHLTSFAGAKSDTLPYYCSHTYNPDWTNVRNNTRFSPGRNVCRQGADLGKKPKLSDAHKSDHILRQYIYAQQNSSQSSDQSSDPSASSVGSSDSAAPSGGCSYAGFHGLYQFDCQTYQSVGCSGDPATESASYQTQCAEKLMAQRGNQPWPVCGAGRGTTDLSAIAACESSGNPGATG